MGTTRLSVITTIESFLSTSGMSERRFGEDAVGDAKVLRRLRAGFGVNLSTIERIEKFIAQHNCLQIAA